MNAVLRSIPGESVAGPLQPQIEICDLVKQFPRRSGDDQPVLALDRIQLQVRAGEFVALLGPSGCGKSTLLNIIAGFLPLTTGQALHDGVQINHPDRRRTVVFQDYALFPWMTIQKNIEFGLKAKGIPAAQRTDIARNLITRVQLTGFENRYPHEVSGGMKQRAAIARALAPDPDILLMDEPFGALDAQTRVLLQEEIARISADTGKTVLFVTHSIEEAVFLADRVIVMSPRPGRIRLELAVPLARPRTPQMRADPWFVQAVADLWDTLKPEWQKEVTDHA
jgi:NitT/TauT family transport system ATP-binding protein